MTPTLGQLTRTFARIGILSFGGPAAQIALMHRELVDRHKWLTETEYLNALSFCMLLPGPEAMQLATYAGWRLHGVRGGLIAGLLFVGPGALMMLALSVAYALLGSMPLVQAMLAGVQATVVVIVIEALLRLARRTLRGWRPRLIPVLAFVGIFALALPFPAIIAAAGLYGFLTSPGAVAAVPPAKRARTARTVAVWGAAWLLPLAALKWFENGILFEIGAFFAMLAVVTFGGAYAVLAYMTQTVVQDYGWLTTAQMIDGLGLAETTPGPLILVTQFVGFLAGFGAGGIPLALAASVVTLWMTFAPCFLWIFAGAPYLDRITARPRLRGALTAITAAVVGVIANLSLWFAAHVMFGRVGSVTVGPLSVIAPDPSSFDLLAAIVALLAGYLILRRGWGLAPVLGIAAAIGGSAFLLG